MDFKACCFFGHHPRCPELINLVIMMIIDLNKDYKELLIPSTYESEVVILVRFGEGQTEPNHE